MLPTSAHTTAATTPEAVDDLVHQLKGEPPQALVFFADRRHDGAEVSAALADRWPGAAVVGCSTAGEFTDRRASTGGISALALPAAVVSRASAALVDFDAGVSPALGAGLERLEDSLDVRLHRLDGSEWVGLVLVDGLHGAEEETNRLLAGQAAPVPFVGGSAADNLAFEQTRVYCEGQASEHGAALLLLQVAVPYAVTGTCSFTPRGPGFTVTLADTPGRVVYEVDGRAVLPAYAAALGVEPDDLDHELFLRHPLGAVVDGEIRVHSPRTARADGGLAFHCGVSEGTVLHVLEGDDLLSGTASMLRGCQADLGGPPTGALVFDSVLRRLELDAAGRRDQWPEVFRQVPTAGFHTYGESRGGHRNQSCAAVMFGSPHG